MEKKVGKNSLQGILNDHFATLRDTRTGKPRFRDYFSQIGLPILTGVIAGLAGFRLTNVDPAVAGVSIVAGLLFGVVIFLFQLRLTLPRDANLTDEDRSLIDETMFNVLWAILWGFGLVLYLVICGSTGWLSLPVLNSDSEPVEVVPSWVQVTLTSVAVAAATHFIFVLAMCLKRIRRAYRRIAMRLP